MKSRVSTLCLKQKYMKITFVHLVDLFMFVTCVFKFKTYYARE